MRRHIDIVRKGLNEEAAKLKDERIVTVHDFEEPFADGEPMHDAYGDPIENPERTIIIVYAELDGQTIGSLRYDKQLEFVRGVDVEIEYRRLGLATILYDHLEAVLGYEIEPSDNLAPDGVKFWAGRKNLLLQRARERRGRPDA